MAKTMPDSFTPRRLMIITSATSDDANGHLVGEERGKRRRHLRDARRDRHGDREDVVHQQRRARHLGGELAEVVAGDDVGAAAGGVGVNGLLVGDGDDRQQRRRWRWRSGSVKVNADAPASARIIMISCVA